MTRRDLRILGQTAMAGMPDAAIDARILVEEVCGITTQQLLADGDAAVTEEQEVRYRELLARRVAREPLATILGHWAFMGLEFEVTRDTLIPEQDTECLVEIALSEFDHLQAKQDRPLRVLDLCTGTGCILISTMLLAGQSDAIGVGTDISAAALAVARRNGALHHVNDRIHWLQGDLFGALQDLTPAEQQFDLILTNPPYIPTSVIPTLEPEVRTGEPYTALCGGEDGLDFYRIIARETGRYLAPGGSMLVETGFDEAPQVRDLFAAQGLGNIEIYQDLGGLERGIVIRTA